MRVRKFSTGVFLFLLLAHLSALAGVLPPTIEGLDLRNQALASVDFSKAKFGTVVVFLSTNCPCSTGHEKTLTKLYTDFSKRGFQFIGVHSNQDEGLTQAGSHFSGSKLPFPVIQDPHATLANTFGALKTPHAYIVTPAKEILFRGGVDECHIAVNAKKHFLQTALDQMLDGKNPDPSEVRVLGCVIKR